MKKTVCALVAVLAQQAGAQEPRNWDVYEWDKIQRPYSEQLSPQEEPRNLYERLLDFQDEHLTQPFLNGYLEIGEEVGEKWDEPLSKVWLENGRRIEFPDERKEPDTDAYGIIFRWDFK